jgi:hypothetical protein
MTTNPVFTVRNAEGQYLGSYRAKNAAQALQRFRDEQAAQAAMFRKSMPMPKFEGLTAKVEASE